MALAAVAFHLDQQGVGTHAARVQPPAQRQVQRRDQGVVDVAVDPVGHGGEDRVGDRGRQLDGQPGFGGDGIDRGVQCPVAPRRLGCRAHLLPVLEIGVESTGGRGIGEALCPGPPRGVRRGQFDGPAFCDQPVGGGDVLGENPQRDAVDHGVVGDHHETAGRGRAPDPAECDPGGVEQGHQLPCNLFGLRRDSVGSIGDQQPGLGRRTGDVDVRRGASGRSPQNVVAPHGGRDRRAQCVLVGIGRCHERHALVESVQHGSRGADLVEPPQDGRGCGSAGGVDGRTGVPDIGVAEQGRQCLDRAVGEHVARSQGVARGAQPAHDADRDDAVATEGEEVLVDADRVDVERVGEDLAQHGLARCAGRLDGAAALEIWRGKRPSVGFAVGGQRNLIEGHEGLGHHVLRQAGAGPVGDLRVPRRVVAHAVGGHQVAHQHIRTALAVHVHDRVPHGGVVGQLRLDLLEFDAPATDLDLVVGATQEFQAAVLGPPRQIACAVHAGSVAVERVRDEAGRGQ